MAAQLLVMDVRADIKEMTRHLTKVQKVIVPKVTSQALNFTGKKIRGQAIKQVSAATGIKQKLIKGRLRFAVMAKPSSLKLVLSVWFMNIFAIHLGKTKGLKVDVKTFSKKFIATMPSGHTGVFARKSKSRLPIDEVSVPLNPKGEFIMVKLMGSFAIQTFLKEWQRLLKVKLKQK